VRIEEYVKEVENCLAKSEGDPDPEGFHGDADKLIHAGLEIIATRPISRGGVDRIAKAALRLCNADRIRWYS
jgi:hypothetical protein